MICLWLFVRFAGSFWPIVSYMIDAISLKYREQTSFTAWFSSAPTRNQAFMLPLASPALQPGRTSIGRRPRLVGIDIDHTLIRSDRTLSEATIDAVNDARAAGMKIVLASSRPPGGMWRYLHELGLLAPTRFVAFQGAVVGSYDRTASLQVDATSPLGLADAYAAANAASSLDLTTNWYTSEGWFVDRISAPVQREAEVVGMKPVLSDLRDVPTPVKLLFIAECTSQLDSLTSLLPPTLTAETSNPAYLEVTAHGVDKATGVGYIARQLGLTFEDVAAIGDGRNDLGLFREAATSIAPSNADPTVLAEADYVTASNDEDGVAAALRWLASLPQ